MKSALFFIQSLTRVIQRFPLVVASSLLGTLLVWGLIGGDLSDSQEYTYSTIAQTAFLGVAWFFSTALFAERFENRLIKSSILGLSIVAILGVHFDLHFRFQKLADGELNIRFLGYFLLFHLLVAFLPIKQFKNPLEFWNFNKTLFIRVFITALYSGVLFLGLAGAILAMDQLFDLQVEPENYGRLWVTLAGIGSTLIFLSGIPEKEANDEVMYPKGLKVFAQYILLPLVLIYLFILYIYGGQILLEWQLPKGWVSNLIMAFAVVGMLTLLLLYPFGQESENKWINTFTRGYYVVLLPLLVLLFIAIRIRILDYGFTELRYALLWLAIWLLAMAIWMFVTNNKKIIWIPVSLFLVITLIVFAPFANAWSVSKNSQLHRLHQGLIDQKIWNGKLIKPNAPLSDSLSNEFYEITEYLMINHGVTGLEPQIIIPDSLIKIEENRMKFASRYEAKSWLKEQLEPFGIYPRNRYDEVIEVGASDTSSWQYPRIELSIYNEPKVIDIPIGNWKKFSELNLNEWQLNNENNRIDQTLTISRDSSLGGLMIHYKDQRDVINVRELIKKRAYALWKPSKKANTRWIRRPLAKKPIILRGRNTILQLREVRFEWNDSFKVYQLNKLEGSIWLP